MQSGLAVLLDEVEARHASARADLVSFASTVGWLDGVRHRRLVPLARAVAHDAAAHLRNEEALGLTRVRELARSGAWEPSGSLVRAIARMRAEHEALLGMLRELHDAASLSTAAADLHPFVASLYRHVQIEDVHLFPRVLRWEARVGDALR